jgi:hypothetical protein
LQEEEEAVGEPSTSDTKPAKEPEKPVTEKTPKTLDEVIAVAQNAVKELHVSDELIRANKNFTF